MSKIIDRDEAIELLRRAVDEKGSDYVDPKANTYSGCEYAVDGAPACIVGHVFSYVGIDPNRIEAGSIASVLSAEFWNAEDGKYEHADTARLNPNYVDGADFYVPEFEFEPDAVLALAKAQTRQDNGGTWGEALEVAIAAH